MREFLDQESFVWLSKHTCEEKIHVKELEEFLKNISRKLPDTIREGLKEEIAEIKEDSKFQHSKRGKYVLSVNLWVEKFFQEYRAESEFNDTAIGAHTDREVVFVTGMVASQYIYDKLLDYVNSKHPPFELFFQVKIAPAKNVDLVA